MVFQIKHVSANAATVLIGNLICHRENLRKQLSFLTSQPFHGDYNGYDQDQANNNRSCNAAFRDRFLA
jgi:hypothetical protein